jgi:hypothetical protein
MLVFCANDVDVVGGDDHDNNNDDYVNHDNYFTVVLIC